VDPIFSEMPPNKLLEFQNGRLLGYNPYNYTYNNPLIYTDPNGKFPVVIPLGIAAAKLYAALKATLVTATVAAGAYTAYNVYDNVTTDDLFSTVNPYEKQTDDQLGRSLKSYEDLLQEHIQKQEDYISNPDAHDDKGSLKNARNAEEREKIIKGRVERLEKQINKHRGEIEKIKEEIDRRKSN